MAKIKSILEILIKLLILYSVGAYIVEVSTGTENSYESHWVFLWSERIIASIFTLEYLIRILGKATVYGRGRKATLEYIASPLGIIDLISILPFWVGFYVPPHWLGMIRTLRILRLLKYFRYSRSLQFVALAFYRSAYQLRPLSFPVAVSILFSTVAMYEAEHLAQPEVFKSMFDSFWFTVVTITTVGYGDMSPITILGKIIAIIIFISALSLFAGIVSVLGPALTQIMEEQVNPDNDPMYLCRQVGRT